MYIVSIGEIFLKGKNRNTFERRLMKNIREALELAPDELQRYRNRYVIIKDEKINSLQRVFGVYSYSKAVKCKLNEIKETALSLINNEKTFRISSKKLYSMDKSSTDINIELGDFILSNKKDIKVDLENPEINIRVEEIGKSAYLYTKIVKGPGGLPVGSSGFIFLRVDDEIKSTVAGYLMMKRGCTVVLSKDLPLLHKFGYGFEIKIREEREGDFVATDETIESINLKPIEKFSMSPLLGYTEKEIKEIYERIRHV